MSVSDQTPVADDAAQRLTRRYVAALSAVALLCILGQVVVQWAIYNQAADARIVNLAGRQRMLSQRLCKAALALSAEPKERDLRRDELASVLAQWRTAHQALEHGDPELGLPGHNSPAVEALFAKIAEPFRQMGASADEILALPAGAAPAALAPHLQKMLEAEGDFLVGMDQMVLEYEHEAQARLSGLKSIELALLGVTLLVLVAEGLLVFRPAAESIRESIAALQRAGRELTQARDEAEAANAAKGKFLASVTHELRTPLNGMIGLTDLTLRSELAPEQRLHLSTAKESAESLLRLVNDILDFSRLEAARMELDPRPFSLRQCVESTVAALAPQAFGQGVELIARVDASVPDYLVGDSDRLRQVLANLVGNAVKFTVKGEVVVRVQLHGQQALGAGESATLAFSVRDTGVGIPRNKLSHVFEAFVQADSSTTRKFGGTGLGLSIAGQLIRLMGGHLMADSELGRGSLFRFTLRLPVAENSVQHTGVPIQADDPVLTGTRTLILSRRGDASAALADMVARWPGKGVIVDAGALRGMLAGDRPPPPCELALIDATAPTSDGVDGYQLATEFHEKFADIKVVLLVSPHELTSAARRCRELGAAFCVKPVASAALAEAARSALAPGSLSAAVSPQAPLAPLPPADPANPAVSGLHILLAEDTPASRMFAERWLTMLGHGVVAVADGAEAVLRARDETFDLILLDVEMPGMDGLTAAREIRDWEQSRQLPRVPIVALTAHSRMEDHARSIAAGMDDHLTKPLSPDMIRGLVERWSRHIRQAAAKPLPTPEPTEEESMPPVVHPREPQVNRERALARLEGNVALWRDLVALFARELPDLRGQLREALRRRDARTLELVAHRLIGLAGHVSAERAQTLARTLEDQARAGALDRAAGSWRALDATLSKMEDELHLCVACDAR